MNWVTYKEKADIALVYCKRDYRISILSLAKAQIKKKCSLFFNRVNYFFNTRKSLRAVLRKLGVHYIYRFLKRNGIIN